MECEILKIQEFRVRKGGTEGRANRAGLFLGNCRHPAIDDKTHPSLHTNSTSLKFERIGNIISTKSVANGQSFILYRTVRESFSEAEPVNVIRIAIESPRTLLNIFSLAMWTLLANSTLKVGI